MKLKELKIFLSSTFKDMHAERDYLLTQIFPKIDLLLRKNGIRLHVVDLRGSEQESRDEAFERNVFSMCLNEVAKCRPRMIGLIGSNYGWIPIKAAESDEVLLYTAKKMAAEHGIRLAEITEKSITHIEIMYGMRVMDHNKCFFLFRQLECLSPMTKEQESIYANATEGIQKLQQELMLSYGTSRIAPESEIGHHLQYYRAVFNNGQITELEKFGNLVFNNLLANLAEELNTFASNRRNIPSWYIRQINYWDDKALNTIPHPELKNIVQNTRKQTITYITGQSGVGKSVLMSQLYFALQDDYIILPFVSGLEPNIHDLNELIAYLTKTLEFVTKLIRSKKEDFFTFLNRARTQKEIVILLDDIDALQNPLSFLENNFIQRLPEGIHFICSASESFFDKKSEQADLVSLEPPTDLQAYIRSIAIRHGKKFDNEILKRLENALLVVDSNLNYAELLIRYLLSMRKEDYEKYTGDKAHIQWMQEVIRTTPRSLDGCASLFIERSGNLDRILTIGILRILKETPLGLCTDDLRKELIKQKLLIPPPLPKYFFHLKGKIEYKKFENKANEKLFSICNLLRPLLIFDATSVHWSLKKSISQNMNI